MEGLDVARIRLRNQRLAAAPFTGTAEVVRWFGAMQAQEYGPAKWSIGQRATGVHDTTVSRAVADGTILRTHALRPTWHFIAREDIGWIQELTGPRVHALNAYHYRQLELDATVFAKADKVLIEHLAGGQHRTRKEIGALFEAAGIPTSPTTRLAYLVMHAELDGLICSGPPRGKQQTYALIEERAPDPVRLSRDAALAELTRRYYRSHGPASAKDFVWWSSLTVADVRAGIEMLGDELEQVEWNGVACWYAPATVPDALPRSPAAHLLQVLDEYTVAFANTKGVFDASGAVARAIAAGTMFSHWLVLDTQVIGVWKRIVRPKELQIELTSFASLQERQARAVQAAAQRYADFMGLPATVTLTQP